MIVCRKVARSAVAVVSEPAILCKMLLFVRSRVCYVELTFELWFLSMLHLESIHGQEICLARLSELSCLGRNVHPPLP